MGLFINQHVNHKEYTERKAQNGSYAYGNYGYGNNCNCGDNSFGAALVTMLPGLLAMGIQALDKDDATTTTTKTKPDTKPTDKALPAPATDEEQTSEEISKKITDLKSQITSIFSEIEGADDLSSLSVLITHERATLTSKENEISGNKSPEKIQEAIDACYTDSTKSTLIDGKTEADVSELKKAKENAENIRDVEIPEQKLRIGQLEAYQGQIENIYDQIDILEEKKQENSLGYNVNQEISDIKIFMSALNEFKTNPSKQNAQKVADAFSNSDTNTDKGVNNKSVRQAYELIKPKLQAFGVQ